MEAMCFYFGVMIMCYFGTSSCSFLVLKYYFGTVMLFWINNFYWYCNVILELRVLFLDN